MKKRAYSYDIQPWPTKIKDVPVLLTPNVHYDVDGRVMINYSFPCGFDAISMMRDVLEDVAKLHAEKEDLHHIRRYLAKKRYGQYSHLKELQRTNQSLLRIGTDPRMKIMEASVPRVEPSHNRFVKVNIQVETRDRPHSKYNDYLRSDHSEANSSRFAMLRRRITEVSLIKFECQKCGNVWESNTVEVNKGQPCRRPGCGQRVFCRYMAKVMIANFAALIELLTVLVALII